MKAEDTVMSRERIQGTIGYFMDSPKILDGIVEVAEQQAEISFKAGIQEALEWFGSYHAGIVNAWTIIDNYQIPRKDREAQLKEWRIK